MRKKLIALVAIGGMLVLTSIFWIGQGTADESTVLGDVSALAECLGVEPRAGIYYVSDILCELARRLDIDCCCPSPPIGPQPGEVIISRVLANAPGSTSSAEIRSEFIAFRNIGECPVDLRGCRFRDEQASWEIPASWSDAVLNPGEEVVFYGRDYNPTNYTQGIALRNSGEAITLECGSTTIDQWRYPGGSINGEVLSRPGY